MAEISNVKNALQSVVKKDRLLNAIFAGSKSFVVSMARTAYVFWLQATGLIFVVLTISGAAALARHWKFRTADPKRFWIELGFTAVCAYFTLHSYLKAARTIKRKS